MRVVRLCVARAVRSAVTGGCVVLMVTVLVLPNVWPVCTSGSAGGCDGLRGVGLCGAGCGWCLVACVGCSVGAVCVSVRVVRGCVARVVYSLGCVCGVDGY